MSETDKKIESLLKTMDEIEKSIASTLSTGKPSAKPTTTPKPLKELK
ncbi:MAG: hypothetical protein QXL29_08185 [Zestosphaera sp.]